MRQVRSNKDGRKFVCGECDTLEACEGKTNLQCQGVDQSTGVQCPEVCCTDCNGVLKTWTLTKKGDAYCLCCESQAAAAAAAVHDA